MCFLLTKCLGKLQYLTNFKSTILGGKNDLRVGSRQARIDCSAHLLMDVSLASEATLLYRPVKCCSCLQRRVRVGI